MKNIIKGLFSDSKTHVPFYLLIGGSIILFIVGWYFTKDLYESLDLLFWDEANYMQSGRMITEKLNRSWGPAYAMWYKLISLFEYDSVKLYYLNFRLMTILPAIALFVFLAISNIRFWFSFCIALLFIFADINLPTWPKVSHYCIMIFLVGMIVAKQFSSPLLKLSILSLFALNIAYARPEFYLSYLSILGLWFIALFFKEYRNSRIIIASIFIFVIGFGLQQFLGNPLFNFRGDRSALAFAQHFMFNYFTWNNIDQDFWITWMTYYDELFGDVTSVKEAYMSNKRMFNLHFLTNVQNYFSQTLSYFSDAMLPSKIINIPLKGRVIILCIGGLIMYATIFNNRFLEIIHQGIKKNTLSIILVLIFIAPTLAACFIIYPRLHYIMFHYCALIFIISILFFSKSIGSNAFDKYTAIFIVLVLGFIMIKIPSTKDYKHFDLWRKETSQANLLTVEYLRGQHYNDTIHIMENEGGINIFLGGQYKWVRGFLKDTTWTAYLEKEHVDIIYVTPSLTKYPTLVNDSTWQPFIANPSQYGYEKVTTGNHSPYLLIHQNILTRE